MEPQDLELIHSDILIAKWILYNDSNSAKNPYLTNQAAYHCAQAIEKSLKAILRDEKIVPRALLSSHNIEGLLVQVELAHKGFINEWDYLSENAEEITKFNCLRYGDRGISRYDAMMLYKEAKDIWQCLCDCYLGKDGDINEYFRVAVKQYAKLEKLKLVPCSERRFTREKEIKTSFEEK